MNIMDNYNYGIIGNCRSAALVSDKAEIVWACLPNFNSPSIFANILDNKIGGSFKIITDPAYKTNQRYLNKTAILITEFDNGTDCFEVIDFMPRYKLKNGEYFTPPNIARYIRLIKGEPTFRVEYNPKLEYASQPIETAIYLDYIKTHTTKGLYNSLYLYSSFDNHDIFENRELTLKEDGFFLIGYDQKILNQNTERIYLLFQRTKVYWLNWSEATHRYKKYNKEIIRSAVTLKLLSYDKTGAVLAAPTTSLPEAIGDVRNWDYRFCWIRDTSMIISVLVELGHMNVTRRFMNFLIDIIPDKAEKIQIMYGIDKEKKLDEKILDHLAGYKNSIPVRIGNAAYKQKQHDIYGILMDVVYRQFTLFDFPVDKSENLWTITKGIVVRVDRNWKDPDRGIWELRNKPQHFTISKILCWVAVDRAIKVAKLINKSEYLSDWTKLAKEIKNDIMKNGWNEKIGAFTQYYGADNMDSANLLMETYGFIDKDDPKFISTVKATYNELSHKGLMYRYLNPDDFGKPTSSFTICSFWMIITLHKIGEKDKATKMFEDLLSYSNHLGLFGEDIDFDSKRQLGNFPQAYSHLALIQTAITIAKGEQDDFESKLKKQKK